MGHPFSSAYARSLAENELDVIYQNHGYLRAHFGDPQVAFTPGSSDSELGSVKLVFNVVPGLLYAWHGADWDGNAAYSSADLDHSLGMVEGEPAAQNKISSGMDAVREAYGRKGYISVTLLPKQNFDDAARQVHYSFQLKEGNQYHLGALAVSGYDDKTIERIRKSWQLKPGDVYDASYLKEFARKSLPGALAGSPATVKGGVPRLLTRPNRDTSTVDVDISLSAN
jgi:outer membrane protein insertion porin family